MSCFSQARRFSLSALLLVVACSPEPSIVCPKQWTQSEMNQMASEEKALIPEGSMVAAELLDYASLRRELHRSCP
jgi:hypothetical protein